MANQYEYIVSYLKNKGFNRYEVSNFSKENYESKHNLIYWNNQEYGGVGLGSSSYIDNVRRTNTKNMNEYLKGNYLDYEEILTNDILYEINKSMIENINLQTKGITEFKEFVEIWIHEIKIPISSMVLKCHNHKQINSIDFLSIIRKLDNNIDQILYYMRSEITEKDFIIGKFCLKEIVRNVSLKNKDDLLENQIKLEVNIDNLNVYTDKKWLEFILNQIVNNSIKYKKNNNSFINITAHEEKDKIILSVYDNGIGIPSKDIKRVFDKSFTGTNGRDKVKSTGMGLYIIKNLCNKLGHNIYIKSEENKYTNVVIEFGKNKYYKF